MKYTYKEITSFDGIKTIEATNENGEVSFIPVNETNADYQEYLKSLTERVVTNGYNI